MSAQKDSVEISRVKSKRDLMEFIAFPWEVYRDDKRWVPPLVRLQKQFLSPSNPFFQHAEAEYYMARRGGKACGRISVSIDHDYVKFKNEKMGCFGFFEAFNDFEVASRLLDTARNRLAQKGMETMRGPFNFSIAHEWGMLVDGFDTDPMVRTSYNPPYYVELVETYGLKKAHDWNSYLLAVDPDLDLSYMKKLAERAAANRVVARPVNLKDVRGEMARVREVLNDAHSQDWGFVPLTDAESEDTAAQMKHLLIEDLAYIGEIDGTPVGVLMFIPDYNVVLKKMNGRRGLIQMLQFLWYKNRIKTGRFLLGAVKKEYHRTGVAAAMAVRLYESAIRRGFETVEFSRILETNTASIALAEMSGARRYKTHRIYEMLI